MCVIARHGPLEVLQEIWDMIAPYFHFRLTPNQLNHYNNLWSAIFKDDAWTTFAANAEPVLIGPALDRYYYGKPSYMVLSTWDTEDVIRHNTRKFFASLREGKYNKTRQEVTFTESGIVLNVHSVTVCREDAAVEPIKMLRGKKRLRTQYVLWNDPECQLRRANRKDFLGPYHMGPTRERDRLLPPTDPGFMCELSLSGPVKGSKRLFSNQDRKVVKC
jgi:hypothetical protein